VLATMFFYDPICTVLQLPFARVRARTILLILFDHQLLLNISGITLRSTRFALRMDFEDRS
jgi:hypothetical protein